jgi:hypothetical protein
MRPPHGSSLFSVSTYETLPTDLSSNTSRSSLPRSLIQKWAMLLARVLDIIEVSTSTRIKVAETAPVAHPTTPGDHKCRRRRKPVPIRTRPDLPVVDGTRLNGAGSKIWDPSGPCEERWEGTHSQDET